MLVLDTSKRIESENFTSESVQFDKNKIRDDNFQIKINEQLTKIDKVFEDNSFYSFRKNKCLYNQLIELYQENLEEYEKKYLGTLEQFNKLKHEIKENKDKIHKGHYATFDFKPIENLLTATNYDANSQAIPLIEELNQNLKSYVDQYSKWNMELAVFKVSIEDNKALVWQETIEDWEQQYDTHTKALTGSRLPVDEIALSQDVIQEKIDSKNYAIESIFILINVLAKKEYDDKRDNFETNPAYKRDFDQFRKEVQNLISKNKKRKIIIRSSIVSVIVCIGIFWASISWKVVEKDGKYGFSDMLGNTKVPIIYDKVWSFSEGFAKVKKDGKYGLVDVLGNTKVPIIYDYVKRGYGSEEGIHVRNDGGNWIYFDMDKNGNYVMDD